MEELVYKTLRINNIDNRAAEGDIVQLFGLASNEHLKKHSSVQIEDAVGGGKIAVAVMPETAAKDAIRLNGIEFYGRQLNIEEDGSNNNAAEMIQADVEATVRPDPNEIIAMELDCRIPEWNLITERNPNGKVKEIEVCEALVLEFPDDPTKRVQTMWGTKIGLFRIQSK